MGPQQSLSAPRSTGERPRGFLLMGDMGVDG